MSRSLRPERNDKAWHLYEAWSNGGRPWYIRKCAKSGEMPRNAVRYLDCPVRKDSYCRKCLKIQKKMEARS